MRSLTAMLTCLLTTTLHAADFPLRDATECAPRNGLPNITHKLQATNDVKVAYLGVFRLHQDVLRHGPDLLFVEFAVNDGGAPPEQIKNTMEGIVRQTWKANIIFQRNRPDMQKDPAKYEGTRWHVGSLMLIGEVIESP